MLNKNVKLKDKINKLEKEINELRKQKLFNSNLKNFILKYDWYLRIKWKDKLLTSINNKWDITCLSYEQKDIDNLIVEENINIVYWKLSDLMIWDIFIEDKSNNSISVEEFHIFVWNNYNWEYTTQYLLNIDWETNRIETVQTWSFEEDNDINIIIFR